MTTKSYKELRWILRGFSGLIIVFFLFMFIGETLDSESGKPLTNNAILQLSVIGIGLIGLGLAWKWELTGGIIALIAFIGLAIINPDTLQPSLLFIYPGTAILFIMLWAISRNTTVKNQ
ncbi:MAG: hypothetical protein QNK35_01990 [Bacteroides sp.]|nr:hypothetical protein [Bacteroides sp.]